MLTIYFHVAIMQNWKKSFNMIAAQLIKASGFKLKVFVYGNFSEFMYHINSEHPYFNLSEIIREGRDVDVFEFNTLNQMKIDAGHGVSDKFLYIHTKGASHDDVRFEENKWWIDRLCVESFTQIEEAIELLETHDAVGPMHSTEYFEHFSGNFFFATAEHLKRLPFLFTHPEGNFDGKLALNEKFGLRHDAEKWVCSVPGRYKTLS